MIRSLRGTALALATLLIAGTTVFTGAGAALANAPSQCPEPDVTSSAVTTGAVVCFYRASATAKICDTAADGLTPYMYVYNQLTNSFDLAYKDPYGSGGCVWAYPNKSKYDWYGDIRYYAVNVNSAGQIIDQSNLTDALW